jgi:hypothetical protein
MWPNPFFVKNTFTEEKVAQNFALHLLSAKSRLKHKQPPERWKFIQSGHPVSLAPPNFGLFRLNWVKTKHRRRGVNAIINWQILCVKIDGFTPNIACNKNEIVIKYFCWCCLTCEKYETLWPFYRIMVDTICIIFAPMVCSSGIVFAWEAASREVDSGRGNVRNSCHQCYGHYFGHLD